LTHRKAACIRWAAALRARQARLPRRAAAPPTGAFLCLAAIAASAAQLGCGRNAVHADAASQPVATVAVPAAAPSASASGSPQVSRPTQALARCSGAYARFAAAEPEHAGEATGDIAVSCADLYSESACAEAFRRWRVTPVESRAGAVVAACRDAYCPLLSHPRPSLCARTDLPAPSELAGPWQELHARILSRELGTSVEAISSLTRFPTGRATSIRLDVPEPTSAAASPIITIRPEPSGGARVSLDGGPSIRVSASAGAREMQPIVQALKLKGVGPSARVVLAADRQVTFSQVIALVDALRQSGIRDIAFAVATPSASAP
jgi:biopolymer transport protein ExbD